MEEETNRLEYGMSEEEMDFKKEDDSRIFHKVSGDYEDIMKNPIYAVLYNFENEFLANERNAYELFTQLNAALEEFTNDVNNYPSYDEMAIVRLFKEIIIRYQNWASLMRQNILLTSERLAEFEKVIEKEYVPKFELDKLKDEMKMQLEALEEKYEKEKAINLLEGKRGFNATIKKLGDSSYCANIGKEHKKDFVIGEKVLIKRLARAEEN